MAAITTEGKTYNGWFNYETWNVALWLGNEEPAYRHWTAQAQECWEEAAAPSANARLTGREPFTREERAVFLLADRLKSELEEENPLANQASMWSDLLGAAMSEVSWREIAQHYIDDTDKTEEPDDEDEDSEEEPDEDE
jgi:hypothetical protein